MTTMRTALAAVAVAAGLIPISTPTPARAQDADALAAETCVAIFDAYDAADRQIALLTAVLNAQIAAGEPAASQSVQLLQISNWMLDKSNWLQVAQLQRCPPPAGRTLGPVQYERQAARCLFDRQSGVPTSRNCDTTRWVTQ